MSNKTLIAYVTKGGATEESGYIIAETLRDKHGLQVDLVNLKKNSAPDLSQYGNVIVGSGVRIGKVYKEALRFLEKDFGDKRVAFFLSSAEAGDAKSHDEAIAKYVKSVLANYPHVKPVAAEAFGGRIRMIGKTFADNRDMAKVRAWAEELGKRLTE